MANKEDFEYPQHQQMLQSEATNMQVTCYNPMNFQLLKLMLKYC